MEITKKSKKKLVDLKYWSGETYKAIVERLVETEWEKIRPKRS